MWHLSLPTQGSFLLVSGVFVSGLVRLLKEPPTKRKIMKPQVYVKWHFHSSATAVTSSSLCLCEAPLELRKLAICPLAYIIRVIMEICRDIRRILVSKILYQARKGNKRHPRGKEGC